MGHEEMTWVDIHKSSVRRESLRRDDLLNGAKP